MTLLINKHTFEVIDYDDKARIVIIKNSKDWLEIPDGAILATQAPDNQIIFWKDRYFVWDKEKLSWEDSREYAAQVGNSTYYNYWKHKVVWDFARKIEHKNSVDPNDPMVAKEIMAGGWDLAAVPDTIYHYAASYNTHRGTTYYDGVVSFPGRITGIEDYRKVRAQIAEDGHVTADRVNVHSLTVI